MKVVYTILILLVLPSAGFSQQLKGIIQDQRQLPIEGAYIYNHNQNEHAHSNEKGRFALNNSISGDSVTIQHLGYENQTLLLSQLNEPLMITLTTSVVSLNEVVVSNRMNALNLFTDINIQLNPVNSSQDILRQVPGLVIGQHAGGGKAEQIFLRGFDIDHGTDINITVDGMPVNMVSHAHGQGYSDLHFVIPETIEKVNFGKGSYNADKGNFTTAGYVDFRTKDRLDNSLVKLEAGQFNTRRTLGMFNILDQAKHQAYVAGEYIATDGPFESSQNFDRINLLAKYTGSVKNDKINVIASHFTSKWDASGQIPQRAVEAGLISRFGAIDDTEGGQTRRSNLLLAYDKYIDDQSYIKNSIYYNEYDFTLFSNFTFFLNDSINGDQIKQQEKRAIIGLNSEYVRSLSSNRFAGHWQAGLSLRNDRVSGNELSETRNRVETLNYISLGDIVETNLAAYTQLTFEVGAWSFNPGLRIDQFNFNYNDALAGFYQTQSKTTTLISPKFNILYNQSERLQYYLKTGKGFHSNDTRVVVTQGQRNPLPASYGSDLGFIWKPSAKSLINIAYWNIYLEQEFVYVGDAGIVEPSGQTMRQGIDLSMRQQITPWLFWNFDANYAFARAIDEAEGENYIPLAPDFTLVSGLNLVHASGMYAALNLRYIKDRPANEDNSIIAEGYSLFDLNVGYQWKKFDFSINIQNLLNSEWKETQFATESRLRNEAAPVEEIHFIPGTPFFLKAVVAYRF